MGTTNKIPKLVFLLLSIGVLAIGYHPAYGDAPQITTFVANDPDDSDGRLSVGDTFSVTFDLPLNVTATSATRAEILANFTFSNPNPVSLGDAFQGLWATDFLSLVINITSIATTGNTPQIGFTSVTANLLAAGGLGHSGHTDAGSRLGAVPTNATLTGDLGLRGSGSGCDGDCNAPTLGVNSAGYRYVTNGFNYNGNAIDVENYFTAYPLITVNVGQKNTATFKIFDDQGPVNIRHFEFAFGLGDDQNISTNKASIIWDRSHDGTETVTLNDPENALDNVNVRSSTGSCTLGSSYECLILTISHTFRAPLDFNIVGSNVWDSSRNAWQNYYNHGIEIVGDSLNPPKEYYGIYKGDLIHLIETGKNTAIDADGNTWTFDNTWSMDYSYVGKLDKAISSQGLDRNDVKFNTYKQGQNLIASSMMADYYKTTISYEEPFAEIDNIKFYEFSETIDKKFDPVLQAKMHEEAIRAEKFLQELFDSWYHHED